MISIPRSLSHIERCEVCKRRRQIGDLEVTGTAAPVCSHCNDSHVMVLEELGREVMCTHCPTPCQRCRAGGTGAFCSKTPCACTCHVPSGELVISKLGREVLAGHGVKVTRCRDRAYCATPGPYYADEAPILSVPPPWLKILGPCALCRAVYTWAQFLKLPAPRNGSQMQAEDEDGHPLTLELRQCGCENTLCRTEPKS